MDEPSLSRGALLLRLVAHHWPPMGLTMAAAGARVGVGESTFCQWVHGQRVPTLSQALRIQQEFGIAVERWREPSSRLE